jgi:hypothetical protein
VYEEPVVNYEMIECEHLFCSVVMVAISIFNIFQNDRVELGIEYWYALTILALTSSKIKIFSKF